MSRSNVIVGRPNDFIMMINKAAFAFVMYLLYSLYCIHCIVFIALHNPWEKKQEQPPRAVVNHSMTQDAR